MILLGILQYRMLGGAFSIAKVVKKPGKKAKVAIDATIFRVCYIIDGTENVSP